VIDKARVTCQEIVAMTLRFPEVSTGFRNLPAAAVAGAIVVFTVGAADAFPEDDEIAVCLGYGVHNSDSCVNEAQETPNPETGKCDGGGEDYYAVNSTFHPYWKARGVYYELFDFETAEETEFLPNTGIVKGNTNVDNGCTAIPVADLGGATKLLVRMYLDAKLNGITVRFRGDDDSNAEFGTGSAPQENGTDVAGMCGTDPLNPDPDNTGLIYCQPNETLLTINSGNNGMPQDVQAGERYNVAFPQSEVSTVMALAQFPVFWWNQNLDILKSKDPTFNQNQEVTITLTLRNRIGQGNCTAESPCSTTGWLHTPADGRAEIDSNIQTEWPRYSKKFIVAHEVGHALEMIWSRRNKSVSNHSALIGDDAYDLDDSMHPDACKPATAVVSHGLTTVEHVSAAANEGFAHFFAADVYNEHTEDDGKFNYYKISEAFGFDRDVYLDQFESVREDICGGGGTAGSLGNATGVEEDWLRLFWNIHSWINREDGFSSSDTIDEARAQELMMAMHAGVILDETGGGAFGSDVYYDLLAAAICDGNSELVEFIEKLDVDINAVRSQFFDFVSEFGVWTGASFSEPC
jgi:hypothetical protein